MLCSSVHHEHVWAHGGQRRASDPSKLYLLKVYFLSMQTILGIILGWFALNVLFF